MINFKQFCEDYSNLTGTFSIRFTICALGLTYVSQLEQKIAEIIPRIKLSNLVKLYRIVPGVYMSTVSDGIGLTRLHYYSDDFNLLLDAIEQDLPKRVPAHHLNIWLSSVYKDLQLTGYDNMHNAYLARERVKQIKHLGYSDVENSDIL